MLWAFSFSSLRNMKKQLFFALSIFFIYTTSFGQFALSGLQVEYEKNPMAIEVRHPRFSWMMEDSQNGAAQIAYRLHVSDENGKKVWDSGRVNDDTSVGIEYSGESLHAASRYNWTVEVWNNKGESSKSESWFETGLMAPSINAWSGAKWIGGSEEDLVFFSHYFSVYKINFDVRLIKSSGSTKAAFVFGANDRRLMNKNLNIQGVENNKDESFVAFELDISPLSSSDGKAKLNIYRVGYDSTDSREKPFETIEVPRSIIHQGNRFERHTIYAESNFGIFTIYIDGQEDKNRITVKDPKLPSYVQQGLNLNPIGPGNNFISFPMIADIGFWLKQGQQAHFSNVEIKNYRSPSNILFKEKTEKGSNYSGIFKDYLEEAGQISLDNEEFTIRASGKETLILADPSRNGTPILRTVFDAGTKQLVKARMYVTARGIYEIYLNGERVGEDYFNPGLTQYNKNHMYQAFDVTDLVRSGKNAWGALLGEGWWSGNMTYSGENWNYFGDRQSLLIKLVLTYQDGTTQEIVSQPETWKVFHEGPIRYGSFFQGEVYDATRDAAVDGWSFPDFDDQSWPAAKEVPLEGSAFVDSISNLQSGEIINDYDKLKLLGQLGNSPKIVKTLTAQAMEEVRPGVFVYDMGQNMVGFPQISLKNGRKGAPITLRYAEVKYPDLAEYKALKGMIMLENIRAALTQDVYYPKGGAAVIQPRFTFHGYRFLEITGIDKALPLDAVKGKVVSSVHNFTAHYETSNPLVNKLWENITWSMLGNFLSIPTDTPARNERMGWSGDINVFSRTATYMADVNSFLKRHLMAIRDIQRPDGRFPDVAPVGGGFGGTLWGSAGIIVPWETYSQYGDLTMLEEHYDAMKDYMEFLETKIDPETKILNEGPLGDWLSPEGNKNDNTLLWTAYHIYCLELMGKMSALLGHVQDKSAFDRRYEERKAFFNTIFVDPVSGKTIKSGTVTGFMAPPGESDPNFKSEKGQLVDTQASYAIPLAMGAFDEKNIPKTHRHLAETVKRENKDDNGTIRPGYSLMTGFIGTASLAEALSKHGYHDLAYRLLQQTSYPSWLYSVKNGATTIWERLNSYTVEDGFGGNNSMNSFNHYSFGAIGAWMMNQSLGIERDDESPGFKHFILQPTPDPTGQMTWAKGHYDSMYGRIKSEWNISKNTVSYHFTIPANTSATLHLQAKDVNDITANGKKINDVAAIEQLGQENGKMIMKLSSGKYDFQVEHSK